MFAELNLKLHIVKENLRKKEKYEVHIQRLLEFLREEEQKRDQLERQLKKEQADVARLENFSVANIFYSLIGEKLEKLDKEQQEVLVAKLKYEEALETIEDVKKELSEYNEKLALVANAQIEYEELMRQKEQLIHNNNTVWTKELVDLTEREASLSSMIKEYEEAIVAGEEAGATLKKAVKSLDSAMGWSTFDMFGGGFITTALKHDHVDHSKTHIHQAQRRLRHFQTELLDIENHLKIDLKIDGLLTFADYFFDGLIVDWVVHGQISDSYKQTKKVHKEVESLVRKLKLDYRNIEQELTTVREKRRQLLETIE